MNQDQKLGVYLVVTAGATVYLALTCARVARRTKRLNAKTDMLLKLNHFHDPSLIK